MLKKHLTKPNMLIKSNRSGYRLHKLGTKGPSSIQNKLSTHTNKIPNILLNGKKFKISETKKKDHYFFQHCII